MGEKQKRIKIKISRPPIQLADPPLDEMYHDEEDEKAEVEETKGSPKLIKRQKMESVDRTKNVVHSRANTVYHDFDTENKRMYIMQPQPQQLQSTVSDVNCDFKEDHEERKEIDFDAVHHHHHHKD